MLGIEDSEKWHRPSFQERFESALSTEMASAHHAGVDYVEGIPNLFFHLQRWGEYLLSTYLPDIAVLGTNNSFFGAFSLVRGHRP